MGNKLDSPPAIAIDLFSDDVFGKTTLDIEQEFQKELLEYVEKCIKVDKVSPDQSAIHSAYMTLSYKLQVHHYLNNPLLYIKEKDTERATRLRTTSIYLIKNTRNQYTKIGHSKFVLDREKTLQSEEPEVELIYFKENLNTSIEKSLHNEFKEKRVRGEWFNLSDIDIKQIIEKLNSL